VTPPHFLGVDGGATSTVCAVCDADGRIVGVGRGGPSNHILAPGGEARARAAVEAAVGAATAAAGLPRAEFAAACFGMTGINRDTEQARVFARIAAGVVTSPIVQIDSDASVALAGALACRPGVVVIAGTGSVAFGRDPSGREARAGGWGYLFGDEGSGFAIGLAGVRAALRARDGSGPPTALETQIARRFGGTLGEIPSQFYEGRLERPAIAALAPTVIAAAAAGDRVAAAVVEEAAAGLAALAHAVIARLAWDDGPVPLAPVGGVFEAGPVLRGRFAAAVASRAPTAVLVPPRFAPAVGGLLLALHAAGVPDTTERLALLAATWELRTSA
jgi:N-acetylglucosamine kinase-like BadF-type ATPase